MNATSPRRQSTARSPYAVELGYRSPTEYGALSSDGVTIYSVRHVAGAWVCMCKGYSSRQTCCHTLAAALPRCFHCDRTEDVHLYRNPYEAAPIVLCGACAGETAR